MKLSQRWAASLVAAVLGLGSVASCSAILGLEDHEAFPGADASIKPDSEAGAGGTGGTGGSAGAAGDSGVGAETDGESDADGDVVQPPLFGDVSVIATGMENLSGITLDNDRVYWASRTGAEAGLHAWTKGAEAGTATLLFGVNHVERVATDADRVYFLVTSGLVPPYGVKSIDKAGADETDVVPHPINAVILFSAMAIGPNAAFAGRGVRLLGGNLDGSTPCTQVDDPPCELEQESGAVVAVTIAGGMLYYATPNLIRSRPADLQKSVAVDFVNASKIEDIVGDASYLYWIDLDGKVNRADLTSGDASPNVTVLAQNQVLTGGHHIAIDTTHVFWTTEDGHVRAIAKTGEGGVIEIAQGQQWPNYVAADSSGVYWTNRTDETVAWAPRNN